jgi:cellobiose phosphorylase
MKPMNEFYEYHYEETVYRFLPTGDIFDFTCGNLMLNQFRGNPRDGSANNIYLRIYKNDRIEAFPLLGIKSGSKIKVGANSLLFQGSIEGITYEVTFRGADHAWFWEVELDGNLEKVDLLYGQDVGNATVSSVLTNELYTSQYLGHNIFTTEQGFVICSRQNMEQEGKFPLLQQGTIGARTIHYSTDGMQFFGLSYKETNQPEAACMDLPDRNYQFEFAYTGLQTEQMCLDAKRKIVFYGYFLDTIETAVTEPISSSVLTELYQSLPDTEVLTLGIDVSLKSCFGQPYSSPELSDSEIYSMFTEHLLEEQEEGRLLSFFTKEHSHVVTKRKELLTERPHGTILTTCFDTNRINSNLITSTNYMYGLFHGQTVVGNTSLHKFLSTPRGLLNLQKNSGQRLFIKLEEQYRLLTLPAIYEMGMNYTRWYYVLPQDVLIVTAFAAVNTPDMILEVSSREKKVYDFILTNQLVLGEHEFTQELHPIPIEQGMRFPLEREEYPGLHYDLQIPEVPFIISDDRIFYTDEVPRDETFVTILIKDQSSFQCVIRANLEIQEPKSPISYSSEEEIEVCRQFYRNLNRNFQLRAPEGKEWEQLEILNQTAWWYSHNAMVHFAVPHGLEQPGGAAWGTRDVCQGPMEYFLMTQQYDLVKEILLNIFSHQSYTSGEWPQWFMFDRYCMDAGECHGDVVFWPLKCVADYIMNSGDASLLELSASYADESERKDTILSHIMRAYEAIEERFIGETGLLTYAGGDWDDTLQPADPVMKKHLISSWTVALAYQTLKGLQRVLAKTHEDFAARLLERVELIQRDFSLLVKDGVIAGFARDEQEHLELMLHPTDTETGIQYRLIPMTRSIIAELVEPTQAGRNMQIIEEKLQFPDGVRLMDRPAKYTGGVSRLFKRAEQAANVGREISLQYTHAHIRYLEACAKLGYAEKAWEGLFTINPIQISKTVRNACHRQSNLYFSSSDGLFFDRYEYNDNFHRLREGSIPVKGGWRLYSSGPGIYMNQLVSNLLGIRFSGDGLMIDPVLPEKLNGLEFTYTCFEQCITFRYHFKPGIQPYAKCGDEVLDGLVLTNPYREAGFLLHRRDLEMCNGVLNLYFPCQ